MRTISAALEAAQKSSSALPYVEAQLSDYHGDVSRLRFGRYYTGSEGEYYSAVTGAGDGSLIRARIDPATKVLYTQRTTAPGPASDYTPWTSHGAVSASGAVALAASGSSVFLFYVDADTVTLKLKTSTDNGQSYGAATTVATAASAVTYLAAAVAAGGDRVLFWTVGAVVWKSRFAGGSWGTPAAWSNSVASLTGIACRYRSDWNIALCGTETTTTDAKVWTCVYGDGAIQTANTWSTLKEVTSATATTNVTFRAPAVDFAQHWRLFFVEKYTGSLAYSRLQWSTMPSTLDFKSELWREPATFAFTGDYGVASVAFPDSLWLSAAAGVWNAPMPVTILDVSADLLEAAVELDEYDGHARIVLRNDDGRFNMLGTGANALLRRGARLRLAPGYRTTAGAEAAIGPSYWVEAIEQITGPQARVVLQLRDAWWLLEQWRARRQFTWTSGARTLSSILQFICTRAGLDYGTLSNSAALTALQPAFTIQPGESGQTAVRRLLAMVPDEAIMAGALCSVRYPQASDSTTYAFGADHTIVSGRYRDAGEAVNRVRAFGPGLFDERFDHSDTESAGERMATLHDLNLTTTTIAGDRAAAALRDAEVRARRDEIDVFGVSCGLELYDVVSVTEAQIGISAAKRRVLGLTWRYTTGRTPRYDMTLRLGNP